MEISEAQKKVEEIILHYGDYWEPLSMMASVSEEVGELARAMNIKYGGKKSKGEEDGREIEEEMADILVSVLAIANVEKIDMGKALNRKIEKDYEKMKGVYVK